jgi:AcrR family transcriptional regulator
MARWEPDARGRLQAAAIDLFSRQGFEETTVADIAATAGVTERTFYRHFADKREVIFTGQDEFEAMFVAGLDRAPADAAPMEVVTAAIEALEEFFTEERRPWSRRRQVAIEADPGLREREMLKLSGVTGAMAAALRERGVGEPAATLAAESAMTVFRLSFAQWLADGEERPLVEIQRDVLAQLRTVAGA